MGSSHTVLRSALPGSVDQQSALVNGAVCQAIPPARGALLPVAVVSTRGDDEEKALLINSTPWEPCGVPPSRTSAEKSKQEIAR
jgi:hypothetical protein